jgi:hypothetical protein
MSECSNKGVMKEKCENHSNCMKLIQAVLDGSASSEEIEHFKTNIEQCIPCIEGYELEKTIKESLNTKVDKKCCPKSTLEAIKSKIGISMGAILVILIEVKLFHLFFS